MSDKLKENFIVPGYSTSTLGLGPELIPISSQPAGHAIYSGRLSLLSAATFPLPSRTSSLLLAYHYISDITPFWPVPIKLFGDRREPQLARVVTGK